VTGEPLSARSISIGYGRIAVVRNLDLTLRAGEVTCLLGTNGAGKTTTILGLAGVLPLLHGELWVGGKRSRAPLHQRARAGTALVTEDRPVFMRLSVKENLRLGRGGIDGALSYFPELHAHLSRPAGLLSGGQQQMLALARALASRPKVLLIDELSFGLAPQILRRLLTAVRAAADDGVSVLLVEQHARQALLIADRAYVMRGGEVVLSGAAAELLQDFDVVARSYMATGSS
jgi:branched-chain amino acid transport system ATP-binding protein